MVMGEVQMMDYKYRSMVCNDNKGYEDSDMNSWRRDICASPADTYIERCFEEKCKLLNNGFDIITEWRTRKREYISYLETIAYDFLHYSRHDQTHSVNILESIEMLLGKKRIDLLSAGDLWMLLECAYRHDIGMSLTYKELIRLWEDDKFQEYLQLALISKNIDIKKAAEYYNVINKRLHELDNYELKENSWEMIFSKTWPVELHQNVSLLVAEYIRKHHAELVWEGKNKFDQKRDSIIPERLDGAVYTACDLHGKNFDQIMEELRPCCKGFGNTRIHPRFAAAMLRMGDLLDMDNNRFNPYAMERYGELPAVSKLHWEKHKAITHIAIRESGVEAEAISDDVKVCSVISDWFESINKETKNLICYWNKIVPIELKGCFLEDSDCKVFFHSETGKKIRFDFRPEREFEVDKKKLIGLLSGNNIYSSSMDFIREYLQNALDAVKMQLWLDLKNGKYRFHDELDHNINEKELTPFDIGKKIYDDYEIVVRIELVTDEDTNIKYVKLIFEDHGIGMEKECVKVLSKIGTGWRGRDKYSFDIKQMPKWLRPTGGFGIGIQSAFMVTEKVKVITRDESSLKGYELNLHSTKERGTIEKRKGIICDRGTKIEIQFPLEKLYESNYRYKEISDSMKKVDTGKGNWAEALIMDFAGSDYFNEDKILEYTVEFIKQYIKVMLPCSFIPIRIIYTQKEIQKDVQIRPMGIWFDEKKVEKIYTKRILFKDASYLCTLYRDIPNNEVEWTKSIERRQLPIHLIIWDEKKCIAYYVDFAENNNGAQNICFKNILVKDEILADYTWNKYFTIRLDYMGYKAEKILNVHRDKFNENFAKSYQNGVLNTVYGLFFMLIDEVPEEKLLGTFYHEEKNSLKILMLRMLYASDSYHKLSNIEITNTIIGIKMKWYEGKLIEEDTQNLDAQKVLKNLESVMLENHGSIVVKVNQEIDDEKKTSVISQNNINKWYQTCCEEGIKKKKDEIRRKVEDEYLAMLREKESKLAVGDGNVTPELTAEDKKAINEIAEKQYLEFYQNAKNFNKAFIPLNELFAHDMIVIMGEDAKFLLNFPNTEVHTFQFEESDVKYAYITQKQAIVQDYGQEFYKDSFERAKMKGVRYIAKNVEEDLLPNLQVEKLPFSSEKEDGNKPFIISPIDWEAYKKISEYQLVIEDGIQKLDIGSNNNKLSFALFLQCVTDTSSYPLLMDYVYKQRCDSKKTAEKISKKEIEQEYEKYIRKIYDVVIGVE